MQTSMIILERPSSFWREELQSLMDKIESRKFHRRLCSCWMYFYEACLPN